MQCPSPDQCPPPDSSRIRDEGSIELVEGIVAYNEELRIRKAIDSLLSQSLPPGVGWSRIWVVASGSTDRTVAEIERVAASLPVVGLIHQPRREGKAAALRELFARTNGEYLVLLSADAEALPGSVRAPLRAAEPLASPFAVMGRPLPSPSDSNPLSDGIGLFWEIHHRLHLKLIREGKATHVSDELLLLPIDSLPPIPEGVVNDGAFSGAWIRRAGGRLACAPDAGARIEVPQTFSDHWRQRGGFMPATPRSVGCSESRPRRYSVSSRTIRRPRWKSSAPRWRTVPGSGALSVGYWYGRWDRSSWRSGTGYLLCAITGCGRPFRPQDRRRGVLLSQPVKPLCHQRHPVEAGNRTEVLAGAPPSAKLVVAVDGLDPEVRGHLGKEKHVDETNRPARRPGNEPLGPVLLRPPGIQPGRFDPKPRRLMEQGGIVVPSEHRLRRKSPACEPEASRPAVILNRRRLIDHVVEAPPGAPQTQPAGGDPDLDRRERQKNGHPAPARVMARRSQSSAGAASPQAVEPVTAMHRRDRRSGVRARYARTRAATR
jgi:hypothetical protein